MLTLHSFRARRRLRVHVVVMQYECYEHGAESLKAVQEMAIDWKVIASAIGHVASSQLRITEAVLRVKYRALIEEVETIILKEGVGFPDNEAWLDVTIPEELRSVADEIVDFVMFCEDDYDHVNLLLKRVVNRVSA